MTDRAIENDCQLTPENALRTIVKAILGIITFTSSLAFGTRACQQLLTGFLLFHPISIRSQPVFLYCRSKSQKVTIDNGIAAHTP